MITGGLILAVKNLLVNYFGMSADGGTATLLLNIFTAGFSFFPIWIGYSFAKSLRMEPIMGGFLGAVLFVCSDAKGLDFLGLSVPTVTYAGSVFPIILGVAVMYFVDKFLKRVIPEMFVYFLKPILTMIIVVPITLIVLGPIGTVLSNSVGAAIQAVMSVAGWIAMPILSALYPYMVMLGLDKAFTPIMAQSIAEIGYDPFNMVMGLVSNLCIGDSALAVAFHLKEKGYDFILWYYSTVRCYRACLLRLPDHASEMSDRYCNRCGMLRSDCRNLRTSKLCCRRMSGSVILLLFPARRWFYGEYHPIFCSSGCCDCRILCGDQLHS